LQQKGASNRLEELRLEIYEKVSLKNHEAKVLKNTRWHQMLDRIEAEWDILLNFKEAAGAAFAMNKGKVSD